MAYSVAGNTTPTIRREGDRWYATFTLVETDAEPTSECQLSLAGLRAMAGNVNSFTITYFSGTLTTKGTANTIRPKMGRTTGWAASTNDHIVQVGAGAAVHQRVQDTEDYLPFVMGDANAAIFYRSTPDAGVATRIDVEITIMAGH